MSDLPQELRASAQLLDDWERFKFGDDPPRAIDYRGLITLLSKAAIEIERRSRLSPFLHAEQCPSHDGGECQCKE